MKQKKIVKGKLGKAQAFFDKNRLQQAYDLCQQLCSVSSENIGALFLLGRISMRSNKFSEAEMYFTRVALIDTRHYEAYHNKGLSQVFQGKPNDAFISFKNTLAINPNFASAHASLGCLFRDAGRYEEAEASLNIALQIDPNHIDALIYLANLVMFTAGPDEAYGYFKRAQAIDANNVLAIIGIATVLEKRRKYDDSYLLIKPLIKRGIVTTTLATLLASLSGKVDCEQDAAKMIEKILRRGGVSPIEIEAMNFLLGKLYDHIGEYNKAYSHFDKANNVRNHDFDVHSFKARISLIKANFSQSIYSHIPVAVLGKVRPIFILGMPRSGTTLVEQIIASHSEVAGGGELPYLEILTDEFNDVIGDAVTYPECMHSLEQSDIQLLADRYTNNLLKHSDGSRVVTDKMTSNYLHIGLIRKLFPDSPILHCTRNALDVCISCYFQNFGERHAYVYSLEKIGEVYKLYEELMEFWKTDLNIAMLDVNYENLVSNPEQNVRAILEYCGLSWDEQCLSFHTNKRYAQTASYDQVRKPMYQSSMDRWKNYEQHICKLRDKLTRH